MDEHSHRYKNITMDYPSNRALVFDLIAICLYRVVTLLCKTKKRKILLCGTIICYAILHQKAKDSAIQKQNSDILLFDFEDGHRDR